MKFFFLSMLHLFISAMLSAQQLPADKNATKETIHLYNNLKKLSEKGFMIGHQDDLAYGVEWRYKENRSDIKDVTGDYPAVYGWDLGGIEKQDSANNLDGVPFEKMKEFIRQGYSRGGVVTISWHLSSPSGAEKGAWDTTHGTVASVLPAGINNKIYKEWIDKAANFFSSLKGNNGEAIPVLFRPFHELTGNWFWWGRNACSEDDFKALWRYTVYYLQQIKQVHNLLWVYSTSDNFKTKEEFLQRYPGDDAVDIFGFDAYQYDDPQKNDRFQKNVSSLLAVISSIAKEKNKLSALSETGYEAVPYADWWTQTLLKAIGDNKISYVLLWRNHGLASWNNKMHYYAPYKGQISEADFIKFYNLDKTLFQKDVSNEKVYK